MSKHTYLPLLIETKNILTIVWKPLNRPPYCNGDKKRNILLYLLTIFATDDFTLSTKWGSNIKSSIFHGQPASLKQVNSQGRIIRQPPPPKTTTGGM